MPLPLRNVGEGFSTKINCQQWEPNEPHFSRVHEVVWPTNYSTSTAIHLRVASPRTISLRHPAMSPLLEHQTLHR